jgi:hypothetical protein
MGWRGRSRSGEIRYTVGWIARKARSGVFKGFPLPGGGVVRVMDKAVHMAAFESAGRKLKELLHKSGKREPGP